MTPMLTAYKYDQLNRIKQMKAYSTMSQSTPNEWNNGSNNANQFTSNYSYDANGNIISLKRRDIAGVLLDDLQYKYDLTNQANYPQAKRSNRLYSWAENAGITSNGEDIEAPTTPFSLGSPTQSINSINNFRYDEIGNLVYDESNHITNIEWNAYGKMTKITKSGNFSDLEFLYDGNGNRIQKIEKVKLGGVLGDENNFHRTYYVHDAQGNILSVYESRFNLLSLDNNYYLQEINLYGSSRLGMYRPKLNGNSPPGNNSRILGLKEFELTNHLGNVLTVVSDRKIPVDDGVYNSDGTKVIGSIPDGLIDYYKADVKSSQDYYPFGMIMPGRNVTSSDGYKFGFNGQEKDDEIKGASNSYSFTFRIYDPRMCRWLSMDPMTKSYPWYTPYQFAGNKPIGAIDLEGLEEYWVVARSFIPAPKLSNPDPFSLLVYPYYLGDNRKDYKADAGKSFRTEQYANLNFNNGTTAKNQFASPTIAVGSNGDYITSSNGSSDAGKINVNLQGKMGMVNFVINAKNQLAAARNPFTPAINAKIDVAITNKDDGSFDYSVNIPEMDGFPAYELWINNDKGNSYLLFGRNPNESRETPFSLFGSGEHKYNLSGNSKDLISRPVQTFEERKNPEECSDDCQDK